LEPLVIEGSLPGGQLTKTSYVENWPGIQQILGADLMLNLREHAAAVGAVFSEATVTTSELEKPPFKLRLSDGSFLQAQSLILATGSTPKKLGCLGEEAFWGKGVTTCAVCDGVLYRDMPIVVVGGGDSAMENASFMSHFTQQITVVHILGQLTASKAMQERVLNNSAIRVIYTSTVTEIIGDEQGVQEVVIRDVNTHEEQRLSTRAVFVSIGLSPNVAPFADQVRLTSCGTIATYEDTTQTSIPGVFAAGDVCDMRYRQAITSAGQGCKAALDAERYLARLG
jgi:thioredoxin reductase (NADPH)